MHVYRLAASGLQKFKAEQIDSGTSPYKAQTVLGLVCGLPWKILSCEKVRRLDEETTCNHTPQPQATVAAQ